MVDSEKLRRNWTGDEIIPGSGTEQDARQSARSVETVAAQMTQTPRDSRTGSVVILAGPTESTSIVYNALKGHFPISRVIVEGRDSRADFLWRRTRRLGAARVAGQLLFRVVVVPWLTATSQQRIEEIHREMALDRSPVDEHRVLRVASVNSEETIAALRELQPDVVVINGTRIISKRVLDSIPARFINMHAGITPLYRGVHGAYWALADGRRDACGVTVHLVDPGIDTGSIIEQAIIEPTARDNFVTYFPLQLGVGLPMLRRAVAACLETGQCSAATTAPPAGASRLWSHPTLWCYLWNRVTSGVK